MCQPKTRLVIDLNPTRKTCINLIVCLVSTYHLPVRRSIAKARAFGPRFRNAGALGARLRRAPAARVTRAELRAVYEDDEHRGRRATFFDTPYFCFDTPYLFLTLPLLFLTLFTFLLTL